MCRPVPEAPEALQQQHWHHQIPRQCLPVPPHEAELRDWQRESCCPSLVAADNGAGGCWLWVQPPTDLGDTWFWDCEGIDSSKDNGIPVFRLDLTKDCWGQGCFMRASSCSGCVRGDHVETDNTNIFTGEPLSVTK